MTYKLKPIEEVIKPYQPTDAEIEREWAGKKQLPPIVKIRKEQPKFGKKVEK